MSVPGDFTPPEYPGGTPPQDPYDVRAGIPLGAAAGILAGVAAFGIAAVFLLGGGSSKSPNTTLVAQPSVSVGIPGYTSGASSTPTPTASSGASKFATPQGTSVPTGISTGSASTGNPGYANTQAAAPQFYVGECVDTSGSGSSFNVVDAGCSGAEFKIIYAFQNESGNVNNDMAQCYTVNGNDNEFENGDSGGGYTLYCLNSLNGDYSPRRAAVDNCLSSSGTYEVDCTDSRATWIVIGRINGTTDTKGCSQFGSYDYSYYWTQSPAFVLCVDKYKH